MKTTMLPLLAILSAGTLNLAAAMPSGTFNYPGLGAGNQAIWDVSGTYPAGGTIDAGGDPLELAFPLTLVQDGKGKLTGAGVGIGVTIGGESVTGSYTAKGTLAGAGANVKVVVTVKLAGTGFFQGANRSYKATITYNLNLNPATRHLVGSGSGNASATGPDAGSAPVSAQVDTPLPASMTGGWSLALTLQPNRTKYGGIASIALSNGRTLNTTVKGTYVTATGASTLQLKGAAATLNINAAGNPPVLNSIVGTALGNPVN